LVYDPVIVIQKFLEFLSTLNLKFLVFLQEYQWAVGRWKSSKSVTTLFLACSFDFPEVIADQATRGIFQADHTNNGEITALQVAVKYGSCEVLSVFVTDDHTQITYEVVKKPQGILGVARSWWLCFSTGGVPCLTPLYRSAGFHVRSSASSTSTVESGSINCIPFEIEW